MSFALLLGWGIAALAHPHLDDADIDTTRELVVAISEFSPFVVDAASGPTGFSVDLWEALAAQEGLTYRYVSYDNVGQKLDAMRIGDADVAIGGISITLEREEYVDFTLPTFRTGLDILVRDEAASGMSMAALRQAATPGRLGIILGFFGLIVISGHLVWWAERGRDAFDDRYVPGVFEGMYWAIVTASTVGYGDKAPVRWGGRIVAALVIVVSLPMFAVFTAELASTLTVSTLASGIGSATDLRDRSVAVLAGTTGAEACHEIGARVRPVADSAEAISALERGEVEAIVHDAPYLDDLVRRYADQPLRTIGNLFEPQRYGIVIGQGSPHREILNRALLSVHETGQWDDIRARWFQGNLGQ